MNIAIFHDTNFAAARNQIELEVNQEAERMRNRMGTELEIAAAASRPGNNPVGPVINIHGAVGIVQTGDASVANMHQHVGAEMKVQIAQALKGLLGEIDSLDNGKSTNQEPLKHLVLDTIAEAEKPVPNPLKISSSLRTIGETVKFIGTLESAYTNLKPLLGALGIHLP